MRRPLILLAGLLDVLLRALGFVGLALAAGGVAFEAIVLRPAVGGEGGGASGNSDCPRCLRRCWSITAAGAVAVALTQLLSLVVAAWSLSDEAGRWPLEQFVSTGFARAGVIHALLALLLAVVALAARAAPAAAARRVAAAAVALLTVASGGPLTHGASRLDHPLLLMGVTVLHQLPAVVWAGGVVHLVAQWRVVRHEPGRDRVWPALVARFSPLAAASVAAMLAAGLYLTWRYVREPAGLVGTAYGTMLLTKVALTAAALWLAALNRAALRGWRESGTAAVLLSRVPVLLEAEAAIAVCVLMAAAAFTGQPPAVDVANDRATPAEVARVFAPKSPRLTMPPFREMLASSRRVLDWTSGPAELEKWQSDFNHNASGAFVLAAAAGALLAAAGVRAARHWPLVLALLGVFVLVIAEPTVWPLGPEPFWATLVAPEVLVHRLAALLVVGLGLFEWRVRAGAAGATRARYVFPLLSLAGGALMLTHSHSAFATKWAFLIEVSHNALGVLAVGAGVGRWLELRLEGRGARVAGAVWPACLLLTGAVLLFYRES